MEKSKREAFLGVQRKKKNKPNQRNKKNVLNNVVNYLKSDSYMFAPLINSAFATGLDLKESIKGKKRLLKRVVDYLKSESYMYASLFAPQPISSLSKGSIQYVKRATMEISTRTLTTEDNHPAVQSANVIAEDQHFEGNLPETGISTPHTSSHREIVKNMVYTNCRSTSGHQSFEAASKLNQAENKMEPIIDRRGRSRRRVKLSLFNNATNSQRQLKQLRRIIPDCHEMDMDMETLFQRIADYIILLQVKVGLLQNLSSLYGV
ncbi:hypothetical protein Q3G72_012348 [Acer saccharum]|nr:hypothetical protein Q3G72_012348 [Acer saccharum]